MDQVDGEAPEMGKGVGLVVVLGPEAKALIVLHRSGDIENPKDRFVADDRDRASRPLDLEGPLAVHPVDAVVADADIRRRP
jgi:hypothetical protein